MSYSKMALYTWLDQLDHHFQWSYTKKEFDDRSSCSITVNDLKISDSTHDYTIRILCMESESVVYGFFPEKVPENKRGKMAELITRVNYKKGFGALDMDFSDGEVRFYYCLDYEGSILSGTMARNAIIFAINWAKGFETAFKALLKDGISAEEAFKLVE